MRRKKGFGVLKRKPKGHIFIDVARNLTQARQIVKWYPKKSTPKIVHTPKYTSFPYHISCKERWQ